MLGPFRAVEIQASAAQVEQFGQRFFAGNDAAEGDGKHSKHVVAFDDVARRRFQEFDVDRRRLLSLPLPLSLERIRRSTSSSITDRRMFRSLPAGARSAS